MDTKQGWHLTQVKPLLPSPVGKTWFKPGNSGQNWVKLSLGFLTSVAGYNTQCSALYVGARLLGGVDVVIKAVKIWKIIYKNVITKINWSILRKLVYRLAVTCSTSTVCIPYH